jgi:hypothetical protein
MALDQPGPCRLPACRLRRCPKHCQHPRDLRSGVGKSQLPGDPEILLPRGGGVLGKVRRRWDRRLFRGLRDCFGQRGNRGRDQNGLWRNRVAQRLQALADRDGQQAGAAEREEVVFAQDGADPQALFPDGRDLPLQIALRGRASVRSCPRLPRPPPVREQRLPVHLAVRVDGHSGGGRHLRRQHVGRQGLGQEAAPVFRGRVLRPDRFRRRRSTSPRAAWRRRSAPRHAAAGSVRSRPATRLARRP